MTSTRFASTHHATIHIITGEDSDEESLLADTRPDNLLRSGAAAD